MKGILLFSAESGIEVYTDDVSSSSDSSESTAFATPVPSTYKGGAYYTPQNMDEDFYTPWGKSAFDSGLSYMRFLFGAVGLVALLIFAMPYVIDLIKTVWSELQDGMK